MKKRNLFLSLICSIILTVALVTVTIVSIVPKKDNNKVPSAGNVSDNTNVSDGNTNPETPIIPVEKYQDGSAEYPYIIKDVDTFNRFIGGYGYTSGEDAVMVPVMVPEMVQNQVPEMVQAEEPVKVQKEQPVMVEKTVYACTPEGDIIYDKNGEPTLIVVRDAEGNPVMTEKLDAEGNVVMGLVFDAEGNPVMVDKVDENGNVVMQGVVDAEGNPVMTEKLDENGEVVMTGEVDAEGNPVMVEKLDEEGKVVLTEKLDENGNVVKTEKLDEDGNVVYITTTYFELANDIDFAGEDYTTLFNQDKPFNGVIDGKGFALKNITINVTKSNIKSFIYKNSESRYDAHIAVFGTIENAEIVKLSLNNISVSIADDIYPFVYDGEFAEEYGDSMNEITVATLAAVAKNSTVNVNVVGEIDADAYSIYAENNVQGYNAIGGLVAVSNKTTISDSTVNVKLSTKDAVEGENKNYFVGGVAGYAYYSTIKNMEVSLDVAADYEQVLYIGGLVGYTLDTDVENAKVNLSVKETGDRKTVKAGDTINVDKYTWIAGAVAIIQADSAELATTLKNVNIVADVDIDAVYAGVVVEIWSTATEGECVKFEDIIVNSNVNTLQAYGFVRAIANKKIVAVNLTKTEIDEENDAEFNVKLTGTVRLTGTPTTVVASLYSYDAIGNLANVKIVVSNAIYENIQPIEKLRKYGNGPVVRI